MEVKFAKRTGWSLRLNRLTQTLRKIQTSGREVLDLTESNPTRCQFQYPSEILTALQDSENLKYAPSPKGVLAAREAVAGYYAEKGISIDPEHIFLTASTSEAYSFLFRLLLNPGEHLLVPRPSYPLFEYLASLSDVILDPYPLIYDHLPLILSPLRVARRRGPHSPALRLLSGSLEGSRAERGTAEGVLVSGNCPTGGWVERGRMGKTPRQDPQRNRWKIYCEALQGKLRPRTRTIVLVHPNNPTGSFVKENEKNFIIRVAKENNLSLICDEVFLDYAYEKNATRVATCAACREVLTFTLSGISKILGLPQMKLAWIVVNGPKKLRKEAIERLEVIADTHLSVNTPSQQALKRWFSFRESLQKEIQNRILTNRDLLQERCRASKKCELLHAEGGWYAIVQLPDTKSEEAWVLEFLEKEHLLVHPGYFFDFEKEPYIVLSLLPPTDRFEKGVNSIFNLL